MRLRHPHVILLLSLLLLVLGLGLVYSASVRFDDGFLFLKKQLLNAAVALCGFAIMSVVDYRVWRRFARLALICTFVLLGVLFFSEKIRGAQNWLRIFGTSLQPVEFARLALVLFLSAELSRLGSRITSFKQGFLPLWAIVCLPTLFVLKQNDFGSAMVLVLVSVTLLYVAGARWKHLLATGAALVASVVTFAMMRPHVLHRFDAWLHPERYAMDEAYQSLQAIIFIGSGGLLGKGLGEGMARYGYLPDPHTDFIFAVLGEETGFIGCALVLLLFLLLIARAIRIARLQEDVFAQLLAVGIGMSIFWYMAINLLVVTRLFPVTGLPLPFMSYGGSALLSHFLALGLLVNMARQIEPTPSSNSRWAGRHRQALEGAL